MEVCRFESVTVTLGGLRALNSLDFTIDSDDGITGIIGPTGAGKSTALFCGAAPPEPPRCDDP